MELQKGVCMYVCECVCLIARVSVRDFGGIGLLYLPDIFSSLPVKYFLKN